MAWFPPKLMKKVCQILGITFGLLLFFSLAWWSHHYLFPPPLSIAKEEPIAGRLVLEKEAPFQIGDLIQLTLEIESRHGISYQMPKLTTGNLGSLEIKRTGLPLEERRRGGNLRQIHYTLTSLEVGEHEISDLTIHYQTAAGTEKKYSIAPLKIKIKSVLPPNLSSEELLALQIKGAKKPLPLPPQWKYLIIGILLTLIICLIIFILPKVALFNKAKKILEPFEINVAAKEPAHLVALQKLDKIKGQKYLAKGHYLQYYRDLSDCIREYLENRFHIRALEMTTPEFLAHLLQNNSLSTKVKHSLQGFSEMADLVKFAKHMPGPLQAEQDFQLIEDIIDLTKEEPAPNNNQNNHSDQKSSP